MKELPVLCQVVVWDLRGGHGAPTFGARGPLHHSLIDTVHLPELINSIPALAAEVEPVQSSIQGMMLDAADNRRLAFHLENGWSGTADPVTMSC